MRRVVERLAKPWSPTLVWVAVGASAFALVMIVAKLSCVASLLGNRVGRVQLLGDMGLFMMSWFWLDLALGLFVGAVLGLFASAMARFVPDKVAIIFLAVLASAAALFFFGAVQVYGMFGTMPTWQLMESLHQVGDAADSIAAMITFGRVFTFLLLIGTAVAGTVVLHRLLTENATVRGRGGTGALIFFVVAGLSSLVASPSRFELDRNPAVTFASSAIFGVELSTTAQAGEFSEVLQPVASKGKPAALELPGYERLRVWAREKKRNVIVVILESTNPKLMGFTGGDIDNTPTFEDLKENSMFWPRYYAHSPSSIFAIYQVLCAQHTRLGPDSPMPTMTRPRIDCRSFSEVFTKQGYRAGLFHSGRFSYSDKDRLLGDRGYSVLYDAEVMPDGERYKMGSWGIQEEATLNAMMQWIRNDPKKPFFITYIPVYPHHPYKVPDGKWRRFKGEGKKGDYVNAVFYFDQMVAEMVDGLRDLGVHEETLVVFLGDHGEGFGEHPGSIAHGARLYEETARTFALWYAPGALLQGHTDGRPVSHVDIGPTLLDILGMPAPDTWPMPSAAKIPTSSKTSARIILSGPRPTGRRSRPLLPRWWNGRMAFRIWWSRPQWRSWASSLPGASIRQSASTTRSSSTWSTASCRSRNAARRRSSAGISSKDSNVARWSASPLRGSKVSTAATWTAPSFGAMAPARRSSPAATSTVA
jgi:phosphoglycerol transferase MdoB-like AlkP superfamily enzyme